MFIVCGLTSKLPGTQHAPRSGLLLLRVRAERNVGRSRYAERVCRNGCW
jgi:hypothetical protein